jgi:hypothetical protein
MIDASEEMEVVKRALANYNKFTGKLYFEKVGWRLTVSKGISERLSVVRFCFTKTIYFVFLLE